MLDSFYKWYPSISFIAKGILINLEFTILSVFFGLIIASLLALSNTSSSKILRFLGKCYISIFRGTPLIIQISIIYFVLPGVIGTKISVVTAAILSFSLNSGAYVSEILRSGINSVDIGQIEAGYALGLPKYLVVKDIIFPQAIRKILPALINEMVNLLKETSLISIIGGEAEVLRRAHMVATEHYNYVIPMLTAAICYYILVFFLVFLANKLEKYLEY